MGRNKKAYSELVKNEEEKFKKQLNVLKVNYEKKLAVKQKKWNENMEKERKRNFHDNVNLNKEIDKKASEQTILAHNASPNTLKKTKKTTKTNTGIYKSTFSKSPTKNNTMDS